jgi:8-oxo-dGTP pyrophosphatase MutT (NUDIX family)
MNNEAQVQFGVGALVQYKHEPLILAIRRAYDSDFNAGEWELVYGRKKQFEGLEEAIRREAREELGLVDLEIRKMLRLWHFYRGVVEASAEILGVTFLCRTSQRVFQLSSEHTEFRWVSPQDALTLIRVDGIQCDIKAFLEHGDKLLCTATDTASKWKVY